MQGGFKEETDGEQRPEGLGSIDQQAGKGMAGQTGNLREDKGRAVSKGGMLGTAQGALWLEHRV